MAIKIGGPQGMPREQVWSAPAKAGADFEDL
jgi:hypothetical protein